jgi:hypothetical protein
MAVVDVSIILSSYETSPEHAEKFLGSSFRSLFKHDHSRSFARTLTNGFEKHSGLHEELECTAVIQCRL